MNIKVRGLRLVALTMEPICILSEPPSQSSSLLRLETDLNTAMQAATRPDASSVVMMGGSTSYIGRRSGGTSPSQTTREEIRIVTLRGNMRLVVPGFFLCAALSAQSVVVLPFFNQTRQANLDWVGESIAESVRDAL